MNPSDQPTCWIIAGPNGAGKTTFALKYLPEVAGCRYFVNADLIAAGMSPLAPEIVFTQQGERREVKQPTVMQMLQAWRRT